MQYAIAKKIAEKQFGAFLENGAMRFPTIHSKDRFERILVGKAPVLFVYNAIAENGKPAWRLMWAIPGTDSFVNAEGETYAKHFRTMREACTYAFSAYGLKPIKWRGIGYDFI